MRTGLAFELHVFTMRMDRAADRLLGESLGLGYRRYLALAVISSVGPASQRTLAASLGVTEPSVSRLVRAMQVDGLVTIAASGTDRSRLVSLSAHGRRLMEQASAVLEAAFAEVVEASGIDGRRYHADTQALGAALEER